MNEQALRQFQEVSALLNSSLDPSEIRRRAIEAATVMMQAEAGSLLLLDESSGELYFDVAHGAKSASVRSVRLRLGQGIAGYVARTGESLIVNDVQHDSRFFHRADQRSGFETRNMVCVPVKAHAKIIGVLQAINKKGETLFTADDLQSFVALGHQVGIAIENANLYEEINQLFEGFITASVQAIESRDPSTYGHSHRVAALTCRFAEVVDEVGSGPCATIKFTNDQMKEIRYAALLHDFGKVAVRERVLLKERKLLQGDFALLKARFDFIKRTLEVEMLKRKVDILASRVQANAIPLLKALDKQYTQRLKDVCTAFSFVLRCNQPNVVPPEGFGKLHRIANLTYESFEGLKPYLTHEEVVCLSIPRGTLTAEGRREVEAHVLHTHDFLSKIPWSRSLQNVPSIAVGHHEKLDGSGYPRRLSAEGIPVQVRMLTIADIYDALTAADRPYRAALPPSKALDILGAMVNHGKLDAHLFGLFVEARVYETTQDRPRSRKSAIS